MATAVMWMLLRELRARMLRGESAAKTRAAVLRLGHRGFARFESGVGSYATRKP